MRMDQSQPGTGGANEDGMKAPESRAVLVVERRWAGRRRAVP